ncbi:TadE family type IV pilus minor pilin [Leifsonia shinshuensis]|uniref:TadE family type IV pilus minor pilin n=1 Tax=Leifsonia shinshuensis TaxID=150026 RepID=UPI001F506891|nr:TadE family type IV pilus minor pilin [Leifsonia shinshuensis]
MTAEFATALPAVLLCLALCVSAVQAGAQQARLLDHAASAARLIGRGDAAPAPPDGATRAVGIDGGMVCVTLSAPSRSAGLGTLGLTVSARSCVLDDVGEG